MLKDTLETTEANSAVADGNNNTLYEVKPMFHEWASSTPGMITVSRKARHAVFRAFVAAETAVPVIVCAAMQKKEDESKFYFSGICRSKTVRPIDDGVGPSVDEYFTVAIGGQSTILNNSTDFVYAGDMIAWTFFGEKPPNSTESKRARKNPRRIGIEVAAGSNPRVIGRALSFAKPGEPFDLLIKGC